MITKENLTNKLKTLAAGAALAASIVAGTGCDNAQQINRVPTEDIVNDDDENKDEKPIDSNDTDNAIENADSDNVNENNDNDSQPIENEDKDDIIGDNDKDNQPIENEDTDDKNDSDDVIDDNDKDNKDDKDNSDINDNDPIENNDNDNDPSENDDSDTTDNPTGFFIHERVATKEELNTLSQDTINKKIELRHGAAKDTCSEPYTYTRQPEQYDKVGNMYVVDKCEGNLNNPLWLENAVPYILSERYGVPPPTQHRVVSTTVSYSNNGNQSNIKIRVPYLVLDVDLLSATCLSQVNEDTSVIVSKPTTAYLDGCLADDYGLDLPFQTKNIKQSRALPSAYVSLCESMPNYQLDTQNNTCYTTIEDFVWLENVVHKLLTQNTPLVWFGGTFKVDRIERHLDTNKFYIDMTIGDDSNSDNNMNVHIELKNAKSCIDQCYGKEGCTSHIEQNSNASKGCFINGEEVNGEESAQNFKMKKHNFEHKAAPRSIKPARAVAEQYYVKNLRPKRQKWLAQNVRNFGHTSR